MTETAVVGAQAPEGGAPSSASDASTGGRARHFVRDHSLSIAAVGLFLVVFGLGQTVSGFRVFNEDQEAHHQPPVGFTTYLTSAHFGEATFENWESEFLQMGAYVLLTVRLRQRGSAESKALDGEEAVDADPRHAPQRSRCAVARPTRRARALDLQELAEPGVLHAPRARRSCSTP